MLDIKDLKFSRIYTFERIPKPLFEQIKELDDATIDRIYQVGDLFAVSPTTLLYILINELYQIKGVLWAEINLIDAIIFIRLLAVDKEYQSTNGDLMNKVKDFLFGLDTGPALKKEIHFLTTHPKAYQRQGVKRSKRIRMEITDESIRFPRKDN